MSFLNKYAYAKRKRKQFFTITIVANDNLANFNDLKIEVLQNNKIK